MKWVGDDLPRRQVQFLVSASAEWRASVEFVYWPHTHHGEDVMADFTPTQGRYLAFIRAYTNLHGYPPAESEIAAAICVSPPSVNQMVKVLEKKGLILRQPGQPRSVQVLVPEEEI